MGRGDGRVFEKRGVWAVYSVRFFKNEAFGPSGDDGNQQHTTGNAGVQKGDYIIVIGQLSTAMSTEEASVSFSQSHLNQHSL